MTESERQYLRSYPRETISLGITADGRKKRSVWVPWAMDGNAYNMRTPDIWLSPEELLDDDLWTELARLRVVGCYIFTPLTDYGFLARLTGLQDLHVYKGFFLPDLGFLKNMPDWRQLHIEDAVLDDLAPLVPGPSGRCICLSGCTVRDISALKSLRLSELVVLMPQGSRDRDRWRTVPCGKYTYHEYKI